MVGIKDYIGTGKYTVREAAWYARVPTGLMTRWLFGTKSGRAVIDPQYGDQDKVVSFLDLIQTLAIREIRIQHKVPLPKFRQAIAYIKEHRGIDYPFARQHFTYLLNGELVIAPGRDEFIEVSGRHRGQRLIPFVELYLKDLTFNNDGLANRYRIFKHGNTVVEMDPERRFGEPLLPSGYTATTIFESILAEGDMESVARVYGISLKEVETAYQFYNQYLNKPGP